MHNYGALLVCLLFVIELANRMMTSAHLSFNITHPTLIILWLE